MSDSKKRIRGTAASYQTLTVPKCDLFELAKVYSSISNIPERVGFARAAEIALLARAFLLLSKEQESGK